MVNDNQLLIQSPQSDYDFQSLEGHGGQSSKGEKIEWISSNWMKEEKTTLPSNRLRPIPYKQVDDLERIDSKKPTLANSFGNFL
jgi:hypothetical protein